jgi:hypothetical protein
MEATLVQDQDNRETYRVEATDEDGGCEVALFIGPNALECAITFASSDYYEKWSDPQGFAGY